MSNNIEVIAGFPFRKKEKGHSVVLNDQHPQFRDLFQKIGLDLPDGESVDVVYRELKHISEGPITAARDFDNGIAVDMEKAFLQAKIVDDSAAIQAIEVLHYQQSQV